MKQGTESLFELGTVGFYPNALVNGSIYINLVLEYVVAVALVSWV